VKSGSSQIRSTNRVLQAPAGKWVADVNHRQTGYPGDTKGDVAMQPEEIYWRMDAAQARPLTEVLECPQETGNLLNGSAQCLDFEAGETVFRQSDDCRGLYLVVSGQFQRKTERLDTRLTLGPARTGDLIELAATLGDGHHNYTLSAQTPGSVLFLPMEALSVAFQNYPALRMRLLQELAREVSRAYTSCCLTRTTKARRRSSGEQPEQE